MPRADRHGFTLVEILVALVIGALVITSARALLDGLGLHAARVLSASRDADGHANADHLFRILVSNIELGPDSTPPLLGDAHHAEFMSWCLVANGGQERCRVEIVARKRETPSVILTLSSGEVVTLSNGPAQLLYLSSAEDGGRWVERWDRTTLPPLALGIVSGADTIVARIGERR